MGIVSFSIDVKSYGHDADNGWDNGFTDRFLEFAAAHEIDSVYLSNWDDEISEKGVIDFLLNAPRDRCKRELSLSGDRGVTATFYDALVKVCISCLRCPPTSGRLSVLSKYRERPSM